MAKPSHRDKILSEGLRVVHARGFKGASVRDIVQAAGVPQGSFTNHFSSKEAFGLEVIDLYRAAGREIMRQTLCNDALPPLARLRGYIDTLKSQQNEDSMRYGCLLGNFTAEASDHSEPMRGRLVEIFDEAQQAFAYCLRAAVQAGELAPGMDCDEVAGFIVSAHQGATLMAKARRSTVPVEQFKEILFATVLRRIGPGAPMAQGASTALAKPVARKKAAPAKPRRAVRA